MSGQLRPTSIRSWMLSSISILIHAPPTRTPSASASILLRMTDLRKTGGGRNESVLQSSLRQRDRQVGQEVLRGEQELQSCGYAHTSQDRHGLLPRLHLSQGQGNPFHPWSASFQRFKAGSAVPVNGSGVLIFRLFFLSLHKHCVADNE